jgi:WD40 repeat protein
MEVKDAWLRLYDAIGDKPELTLTEEPVERATFSPDASLAIAFTRDQRVLLFSATTGNQVASWPIDKGSWKSFAISPDSQYFASGDEDGALHLWDPATGVEKAHWQAHEAGVTALAFHPEGHTLVSGGADGVVKLWNLPLIRKELAELGLDW